MSETARRLFEEAMSLSAEERSLLAKRLLQSVVVANDELNADELSALDGALDESEQQFAAGQGRDFFTALAELRARS
jgi:hypothetical protein